MDYNTEKASYGGPIPAPTRKGIDHVGHSLDQLFDVVNLAEGMADRIAGQSPKTEPGRPGGTLNSIPTSVVAQMHDHADRLEMGTRRLRDALNRIDDAI